MATRYFDCEDCGGHGKITYKEDDTYNYVCYCPFCGADISQDEDEADLDDE